MISEEESCNWQYAALGYMSLVFPNNSVSLRVSIELGVSRILG